MLRLVLFFILPATLLAQKAEVPFTFKTFANLVNYFDSKKEVCDFFEFKKGDVVADIGAGEGKYEAIFSLLTDSVDFYIGDVDAKTLNQYKLDKMLKSYSLMKGSPQTNRFRIIIGTEKTTNLPDSIFDKIIMISSFHMFAYMDEMIEDIVRKLRPNGRIYIVDAFCYEKGHKNYSAEEVATIMQKHGLSLQKMQGKDKNNSKGLYEAVFHRANN